MDDAVYSREMLPKVSRTFALCIRALPPPLRHQVAVAYLLCRIADEIEDSPALDVAAKETGLARFAALLTDADWAAHVAPVAETFAAVEAGDSAEQQLVRGSARVLRLYHGFSPEVRAAIGPWVAEMCVGMAKHLRQEAAAAPHSVVYLEDVADLEDYCYYVAGTVGQMLTELFFLHSPHITAADRDRLAHHATAFGQGLQLVNIIKDLHDDAGRGRCYLPKALLRRYGVEPSDVFGPRSRGGLIAAMRHLIGLGAAHLHQAMRYALLVPKQEPRIRLFCLWPLFFALKTLAKTWRQTDLLVTGGVKISRPEVKEIMRQAGLRVWSDRLLSRMYTRLAGDLG